MHPTTPNCFSADVIGGPRPVSTIVLSEACQSCKATVYPPLLRSCCGTTSCSMSAPSSASCAPSHCSPRRCRLAARLRAALLAARRAAQVEAVDSTLLQARGGQAEEAAVAARLYMYSADDLAWVNCPRRWISLVCYNVLSIDETRVRLHKTAATYFRARALQVNRHALAQRCAVRAFTVCYKTVKNKRDVGTYGFSLQSARMTMMLRL